MSAELEDADFAGVLQQPTKTEVKGEGCGQRIRGRGVSCRTASFDSPLRVASTVMGGAHTWCVRAVIVCVHALLLLCRTFGRARPPVAVRLQ